LETSPSAGASSSLEGGAQLPQEIAIHNVLDIETVDVACDVTGLAFQFLVLWHDLKIVELTAQTNGARFGDGEARTQVRGLSEEAPEIAAVRGVRASQ
jgi:hypothetical protein